MNKKLYKLFFTVCVFFSLSVYANSSKIYDVLGIADNARSHEGVIKALQNKKLSDIENLFKDLSPYELLGVSKDADKNSIKEAYHKLSFLFHPNYYQREKADTKEKINKVFTFINLANGDLKDPEKRAQYDQPGKSAHQDLYTDNPDVFQQVFNTGSQKEGRQDQNTEELTPNQREAIKLFYQFSFFKKDKNSFLKEEKRYRELLKEKRHRTLEKTEKEWIDKYRVQTLEDIRILTEVFSKMGLPAQAIANFSLESLLDGLRNTWYDIHISKDGVLRLFGSNSGKGTAFDRPLLNEKGLINFLTQFKNLYDNAHFNGLKKGSNPFSRNFLKSFPSQFLVFHAALGASIYLHALSDKQISGYEKNPEELYQAMLHSLTGSGIFSFAVFVAVMQQVHYRVYGLGRFMDGKTVFGRHLNGKLARSLAPSFGLGMGFFVSTVFLDLWHDPYLSSCVREQFKGNEEYNEHMSACDEFYLNWKAGEKWKIYAVDIVGMLGSSVISHKLISSLVNSLNRTMIGYNSLNWFVKKLGPKIIINGNFFIRLLLFLEVHTLLEKWMGEPIKKQLINDGVDSSLLQLSNFVDGIDEVPVDFWSGSIDQVSVDQLSFVRFLRGPNIIGKLGHRLVDPLPRFKKLISGIGHKFKLWSNEVNKHYQQSYHSWLQKLNSSLFDYSSSLDVLKQLYFLSQVDYNETWDELDSKWYNAQGFSNDQKEFFTLQKDDFFSLNNSSYFFKKDVLEENKDLYKSNYCKDDDINPSEPSLSEQSLSELTRSGITLWKGFCEDEYVPNDELEMLYGISWIILNKLERIELPNGISAEDYISLNKNEIFSSDPEYYFIPHLSSSVFSHHEKMAWGKAMIGTGLKADPLSGFDNNQKEALIERKIKDWCEQNNYEIESCRNSLTLSENDIINDIKDDIKDDISLKFLTVGIYILQEARLNGPPSSLNPLYVVDLPELYEINYLIDLFEVYKKGERSFLKFIEVKESVKKDFKDWMDEPLLNVLEENNTGGNPYVVLYRLMCGSEKSEDSFSIPRLSDFSEEGGEIKIYEFQFSEWKDLNFICEISHRDDRNIHDRLRPSAASFSFSDRDVHHGRFTPIRRKL